MPQQRVLCVGNDLCHDDGVAKIVGELTRERCQLLPEVEVVFAPEFGLSSVDAFLGVDHVIVVDAVVTGRRPGTCRQMPPDDFSSSASCSVGHATTLHSMLQLVARLQGSRGAPTVTVIGIEAENLTPFGTTLSDPVSAAVPQAVDLVMGSLDEWMHAPPRGH
jgi:hydrogenase maturation protease